MLIVCATSPPVVRLGERDTDVEHARRVFRDRAHARDDLVGHERVAHRFQRRLDALLQRERLRDALDVGAGGADAVDGFDAGHGRRSTDRPEYIAALRTQPGRGAYGTRCPESQSNLHARR